MLQRPAALLACVILAVTLGGCQILRRSGPSRPTASEIASWLPAGTVVDAVAYADLTGDGRDELLVAATIPAGDGKQTLAVVYALDRRGQYAAAVQRRVAGEAWEPIQVGRPAEEAPPVVVFAVRGGSVGSLGYVVVQQRTGVLQVTLENHGLLNGGIRFVPEGLLESRGDVDRLYRWVDAGWQPEDLASQYVPLLPPETVTIPYFIDIVRGPMLEMSRDIRVRVGQHIFLRRTDRGEPSRISYSGTPSAYSVGPAGLITLLQSDTMEIYIEGPAYSGRTLTLSVRIDPR